jgi:N-acetylglucosamine malate deacetylase 1
MVRLRLLLLGTIRWLLRQRAQPLVITGDPVLVIAPHPDDETLGCGGLIQLCRRAGQRVATLFLTQGEASHSGHPVLTPTELARRRTVEARTAAAHLGVSSNDLTFLTLPDGQLPHLSSSAREAAIAAIAAELQRIRPAVVLAAWRHDGSSEHEAAFPLIQAACQRISPPPRLVEYLVWSAYSPRLLARLLFTPATLLRAHFPGLGAGKRAALAAYGSQFQPVPPWMHAVQPPAFATAFAAEEEFFIESTP